MEKTMLHILAIALTLFVAMPAMADDDKGKHKGKDNCGQLANEKGLKGRDRKAFMKQCTRGESDRSERDDDSKSDKEGRRDSERERKAKESAEQERIAKEKAEQERIAKEKAEQERIAKEQSKQPTANEKMEEERKRRVWTDREKRRESGNVQVR